MEVQQEGMHPVGITRTDARLISRESSEKDCHCHADEQRDMGREAGHKD